METASSEEFNYLNDLYEKYYPKPECPEYSIGNNPNTKSINNEEDYLECIANQFRSYIDNQIIYSFLYPELWNEYQNQLKNWEEAKKKNFPDFQKLYYFKKGLKYFQINSSEELINLYNKSKDFSIKL